jgi:hypothetical protein
VNGVWGEGYGGVGEGERGEGEGGRGEGEGERGEGEGQSGEGEVAGWGRGRRASAGGTGGEGASNPSSPTSAAQRAAAAAAETKSAATATEWEGKIGGFDVPADADRGQKRSSSELTPEAQVSRSVARRTLTVNWKDKADVEQLRLARADQLVHKGVTDPSARTRMSLADRAGISIWTT